MIPRKPSIMELFQSFPSLPRAAEIFQLDATTLQNADNFLCWARNAHLSEAGNQAAYFVATVLNDFCDLPAGIRFDFSTAITAWDEHHLAAFREWACEYLITNPVTRLDDDPLKRKLDLDL